MTEISVTGLDSTQSNLDQLEIGLSDHRLAAPLSVAAGMVHRYLLSIAADTPPIGETGVLPVIKGRLKNSFFSGVGRQGGDPVGFVRTTLVYARPVNMRRRFIERTIADSTRPVSEFMTRFVGGVTR